MEGSGVVVGERGSLEVLAQIGELDALLVLPERAVFLARNDPKNDEGNFGLVEGLRAVANLDYFVSVGGLLQNLKGVK